MSTFYWYDLETFGIDAKFDRIAQFAGIRTDLNLNPINEADMFYCKPSLDTFAEPEACLITGITEKKCEEDGLPEKDFIHKINNIFSEAHTCVVGYNSIRFDDEFIRYGNYRNFIDPYAREWANGNSRWDIIDLVRACYALRPEGIKWAFHDQNKPSFKLTDLTEANNLTHTSAHDALSDVHATIQMAKLIKNKQPQLFEYALKLRNKKYVKSLLNWQIPKPIVHVSNKIPANRGCLAIMLPLAMHPTNPNGIICYDLNSNPDDLFNLPVDEIQDRIFTPQNELPQDCHRIALKTIHLNKSAFIAPMSVLKDVDMERIQLDFALNKSHFAQFSEAKGIIQKVQRVFDQKFTDTSDDVDAQLYSGFFSAHDKQQFERIGSLPPEKLLTTDFNFKDHRAKELLFRYVARNHSENLNSKHMSQWYKDVQKRLFIRYGVDAHLYFEKIAALKMQDLPKNGTSILTSLETAMRSKLLTLAK